VAEELNRWLRAVRPDTAADDNWAVSTEADDVLASVHRKVAGAGGKRVSERRWWLPTRRIWLPAGSMAVVALVTAIAVVLTTGGGTSVPPAPLAQAPRLPSVRPAAMLLQSTSSCSDLLAGLRSHAAASVGPYGFPSSGPIMFRANSGLEVPGAVVPSAAGAAKAATGGAATDANSATNVQEPGVDEPDIVKSDGNRVITVTDGTLRVIDAGTRQVTGSLDLTSYVGGQGAQVLVDGDHALVLLESPNQSDYLGRGDLVMPPVGGASSAASSTYLSVDITGTPRVVGSLHVDGAALDARQVGKTVRLVVSSAPVINFPNSNGGTGSTDVNRRVINQAPLSAWLPRYTLTSGAHTTSGTVPCGSVSHPAAYTGASMLTIYTVNFDNFDASPVPVTVAADGDTVYGTSDSLYVASNPNAVCCMPAPSADRTEIHRFDITGTGAPTYLGSGSVPGHLLSQYSLSAYDGSLRAATTQSPGMGTDIPQPSGMGGATAQSTSSVYVLNEDTLAVTGHVDGLGEGEQIYAVRFLGPLAYVVTFRQTDPLYVVDLRNPRLPAVVGTLQLTGYSDYLHDAGNGRLIGVGQEASAQGMVAGLQVSLFDVSSPSHPVRTGHVVRSDAPGESAFDPHAFLYWQPTGLMAVPIQSWQQSQSGKVLVLRVSGSTLTSVGIVANPASTSLPDDGLGIQRSLLVHGNLWTLSGSGVRVSDASTLAQRSWIPFS
jgi:hypothetical protein